MPERLTDRGGSIIPSHAPVPVVVITNPLEFSETLSVELIVSPMEIIPVPLNTVLPVATTHENTTEPVVYIVNTGTVTSIIFGVMKDCMSEI